MQNERQQQTNVTGILPRRTPGEALACLAPAAASGVDWFPATPTSTQRSAVQSIATALAS